MADPIARFEGLLRQAAAVDRERLPEPTAFALATASQSGRPSVRMLLLKSVDDRGFVFYTNRESRKAQELLANPRAALCFHWQPLEVQVRVEGDVTPVPDEEADAYFATRPRGSQIGAWASRQSRVLESLDALEERFGEFERRFDSQPVPRPPYWGGFRLVPTSIEFWRNRANRLHERERYTKTRQGEAEGAREQWQLERLFP